MSKMNRNKKIVVVGGGTGNYITLSGLRKYQCDVTAIVAMMDNGGSSGRLREELGHLPYGDIRQCLMALASGSSDSNLMRHLFDYRFSTDAELNGHNFGNLLLSALTEITGNTIVAINEASRILGACGAVLPVTLTHTTLCAKLANGVEIVGQSMINTRKNNLDIPIDYIYLDPKAYVYPPVLDAIHEADAIVLGPGDIYTSILPNLLVSDVATAINNSPALKIYICNLMNVPSESNGFLASNFLLLINEYLGSNKRLDYLLSNDTPIPTRLLERYATEGQYPVVIDENQCSDMVHSIIENPLLQTGVFIRHDPNALAASIIELLN